MRKKIALFATGWSEQILAAYVSGINETLSETEADIYLFICYPSIGDAPEYINGETNIFELPDLNGFDGAFIMGNTIDFPEVFNKLVSRCEKTETPFVCTGRDDGVHHYVSADNYAGAVELCDHLIEKHGVKDIFVIAGSPDNQDSNDRLQAVKDSAQAHGIGMPEDNVFYSCWDFKSVKLMLEDRMARGSKLPDAFVCANDALAMLVCKELHRYGVKVPDDVLVTGFDNDMFAQVYEPSISSVNQRFDLIGRKSAEVLMNLMEGKPAEKSIRIPCKFVPSESCGCTDAYDADELRREIGKGAFLENINSSAFQRKLSMLEKGVMQGHVYSDLKDNLKCINENFNNFEGSTYHILLDPLFAETINDPNTHMRSVGYPETMDVVYSMDENEYRVIDDFNTKDIVPFVKDKDKNHIFLCLPLQESGRSMGYVVFADDFEKLKRSQYTQAYVERLSVILSKFHRTVSVDVLYQRLLELSETDALTHVKNRTSYQSRSGMIDKRLGAENPAPFAVVICDINSLKKVNDGYGHENGDKYIINCCNLICRVFKHSAVYRIGGDEFAIVLEGDSYTSRKYLINELELEMQKSYEPSRPVWERPSVAYGLAEYNRSTDTEFEDVVKRADAEMYLRKVAMKV